MTATGGVIALSGWIALAAYALPGVGPLRVLIVTAFLAACPGLSAVLLAGSVRTRRYGALAGAVQQGVLAVALSLSLVASTAVLFYLAGASSTWGVLVVLACLTTALSLGAAFRPRLGDRSGRNGPEAAVSRGEENPCR